jgi:hypothetical protein
MLLLHGRAAPLPGILLLRLRLLLRGRLLSLRFLLLEQQRLLLVLVGSSCR